MSSRENRKQPVQHQGSSNAKKVQFQDMLVTSTVDVPKQHKYYLFSDEMLIRLWWSKQEEHDMQCMHNEEF